MLLGFFRGTDDGFNDGGDGDFRFFDRGVILGFRQEGGEWVRDGVRAKREIRDEGGRER